MHGTRTWIIGLMLAGVAATAATAADWPQWGRTGGRNMVSPEKNLPATFTPDKAQAGKSGNVKWVQRLGHSAYGNPTVADGRVYVGTDDSTLTGNKPVKPAPDDADILWRFDLMDRPGVIPHDVASCSVLLAGNYLYTSTSNGVDGPHKKVVAPKAPAFVVLDKRTGRYVAREAEGISQRLWHAQWCSPSLGRVGGKTLIFLGGGDGILYAFEALTAAPAEPEKPAELKTVWRYDCNPPNYRYRDGKEIPYYEGDKRKGWSTNKNDGKWLGPSQIIGTPVFHKNRVYVAIGQDPMHGRGRGLLHCVDATKTGDVTKSARVWTYDGLDRSMATVSIAEGLLYVSDVAGAVHCLDAETGKCHWVHRTNTETWGGALLADGKAYVGTKRHLVVFAQGTEAKVLGKVRLGSPIYSTPIAANGVLYVASQRELWAVHAKP